MSQAPIPPLFSLNVESKPKAQIKHFDGATFEPELDAVRLSTQLARVRTLMFDGKWRTLKEISEYAEGSEAAVSARLRDLRKPRFGGFNVQRRRVDGGVFEYRIGSNL